MADRLLLIQTLVVWMLSHVSAQSTVHFSAPEVFSMEQNSKANISITASHPLTHSVQIQLNVTYSSKSNYSSIVTLPQQVLFPADATSVKFEVAAHDVGQVTTCLLSNSTEIDRSPAVMQTSPPRHLCAAERGCTRTRFTVVHSNTLQIINEVIGWMYFVAWSISFYPQAFDNWRRKSVVGLNFDFLALNITGFIAYSLFNIGLFWVHCIQEEFLRINPTGINPVRANDVFFSLHAVLMCLIYVCQAAVYERAGQKVSWVALGLLLIGWTFALVSLFLAVASVITWLNFLYCFSYIKLAITLIKYIPQAYMNYSRRSTDGWSIGNVLLDFTGGTLSILQMILQSYNNDEWKLIFGNPTKFGLGLFSVVFDIIFMIQHYCLYRGAIQYEPVTEHQH
ncbi:cystinosin isoform X2 [Genypterus blacodes]